MAEGTTSTRRGRHRAVIWVLVVALLAIGATLAFRGIGRWLVVQDALESADAIVVLSGSMPYRAMGAAKIFQAGVAPQVWLTKPIGPEKELEDLGIEYRGEETYNAEVLIKLGVPAASIHVLEEPIVNTEDEVNVISSEMRRTRKKRAILVTSPPHTRRVRALWKDLAGDDLRAVVRYAPEDPYDASHWWRNTRDSLAVVRESLGLLNAWAGLPVRPHRKAEVGE